MLKYYVIEREIAGVGSLSPAALGDASGASCRAVAQVPGLQWQHSYVAADKTFCIYLAESEQAIRRHAELSGFPASRITEIRCLIDPTTERLGTAHGAAAAA
ncbi:MAG: DUF4242 domain-containing protein [Alphaproteobacteria bacterium]|nr:DUF4242 domain-containing protein [Alphaproteobacteria bacterium]